MDLAPLTDAHAHARKAAALSQSPNLTGAREEHELAAQDFAKAKYGVEDSEALRILDLLEQHHRQLAEIIKSHSSPPKTAAQASTSDRDGDASKDKTPVLAAAKSAEKELHVPKLVARTSTSPVRTRRLHRETSSSIADNLARQRRGLPANPELSTLQAGGRILSHIERPGYNSTRQRSPESTRTLPTVTEDRADGAPAADAKPQKPSEDSFSRFYSTFGGLFEKLSGPLAFAGLPLTPERDTNDAPSQQLQQKKGEKDKAKDKVRASSSDEPDLTKIYSAATLKAIRENVGPSFGPQESFYLVPPTGGTVSYAGMVSGVRGSNMPETMNEDDDEFVDAKESMGPPSPISLRNSGRKGVSPVTSRDGRRPNSALPTASGKTPEELELEITVLKQLLDTQAKRLQMWEMSSQSQSMALQQSMRAVRQRPDLPSVGTDPSTLEKMASRADEERIRQLEALLKTEREEKQALEARNSKIESENRRLTTTVGRYRDKWEQLKAGARKREDDKRRRQNDASSVAGMRESKDEEDAAGNA
ncbi:uncharacterized protein PV09_06511 [Verruconis gallopava]|uniref:Uncharacterized protein n=1 Tax=Verruconis gallopava TaxID=253628 RepID=A0A0D2AS78_9PEZI|nr:uncharacterized protein PV09_06511 [Verruconis gallopava]KIW02004.1 hypothetical protein PV09_06511 [Verruconis gallopava]